MNSVTKDNFKPQLVRYTREKGSKTIEGLGLTYWDDLSEEPHILSDTEDIGLSVGMATEVVAFTMAPELEQKLITTLANNGGNPFGNDRRDFRKFHEIVREATIDFLF